MLLSSLCFGQKAKPAQREYIYIRIYHAKDSAQVSTINQYVQASLFPALEKGGFNRNGAFTAIDNDTASDKRFYLITSIGSLSHLDQLTTVLEKALGDSAPYAKAVYNNPPYARFETILLKAFEGAPQVKASGVKTNPAERVYELRSYESASEAIHLNKVQMFNSGEVDLFQRLGFNAVFYGQVVAGSQMPNLMYMTSFENKAARDEHWKAFGSDPQWKEMSGNPVYKNNVSKINIVFLRPTAYSKL